MPVIQVNDVHKKFKIFYDKGQSFKEKLLFKKRSHYEERWVLDGIDFDVEKGEVVGLIGQNGCGKSTLLKLMTKIMYPDKGNIKIDGRVSSLIELGAGFHPEMSGRENIFTNASIFGLTKKEIDLRLDKIIAFSELEEFIDNPVRTYSSGMYMRLAFSVAINVDADILLIDEILAVGDANFQVKCFEKLRLLKSKGVTIVIVTHDLGTIEKFCTKALWINKGKIISIGTPMVIVDDYLRFMNEKRYDDIVSENKSIEDTLVETNDENLKDLDLNDIEQVTIEKDVDEEIDTETSQIDYNANRFGLRYIEIVKVLIKNNKGISTSVLKYNEPLKIEIYYKLNKPLEGYVFGFSFYTIDGILITGSNTQLDRLNIPEIKNQGKVTLSFEQLFLISGKYILQVAVVDQNGLPMDFYRDYCHFDIISESRNVGLISIDHTWEIE